jgi:threonine dehydratase
VGVVSELAPTYAQSFEQKRCVEVPTTTRLADGLACRKPDATALQVMLSNVDHVVTVSESQVGEAMRILFVDTHNVVEGAGAAALAAALKEKDALQGKKIGVVSTGGNVDHGVYARVLQGKWE